MNIPELLERQTEKYPDKIFLYFEDQQISYQDFYLTVNCLSNALRKLGVQKGQMVAIMLPNCPAFLYLWFAINKIGAIQVPINTNFKENEISYIANHSEAIVIIVHEEFYPILSKIKKQDLPYLMHIVFFGESKTPNGAISFSTLLSEKADLGHVNISEEDPAVCIYTSGTTDRPKGVLNSHKSWIMTGQAYAYTVGIIPEDRVMTPNPLFHANAQVYSTMGSLSAGASLILLKRFSSSKILEQSRYYNASKMILVQAVTPWVWNRTVLPNDGNNPVETMVAGNVPTEIYYDFEKRFQLKIQTIYSLTEAVFAIMGPRAGTQERKPGGIGVPMEHPDKKIRNEIKIVSDDGSEVGANEHGEIILRNPATMLEYFKDAKKTKEVKKNGWIYTGDVGYQDDDGYFFFIGRKKEVIRRRGELISPTEIEAVINSHSSVEESAVIGVASELGSGEEEVKAFVKVKLDEKVTPQKIIALCKKKLAEFKVPRYIEVRHHLPKSAIGRIQKNVLKQEREDMTSGCYDRQDDKEDVDR